MKFSILSVFWIQSALIVCMVQSNLACHADETNSTVLQSPYLAPNTAPPAKERETVTKGKKSVNLSIVQLEQRMYELINNDRSSNGAPAVTLSPVLGKLARKLADDMLTHDFFGHQTSDGMNTKERAKHDGITAGVYENIATRSGPDSSVQMVEELERSFMDEPHGQLNHRFVLLDPRHACVGIGIAKSKNSVIVVQDFTDVDPASQSN